MGWKIIDMPFGEVPVELVKIDSTNPNDSSVTVILQSRATTPCGTLHYVKGEKIFISRTKLTSQTIQIISGSRIVIMP